ncbi:MAG: hypothetical protein IKF11_10060, partial [Methanobrevibacter sp.]|nr:hypothetical protein [Methanobrevibacter sp.]
SKTIKLSLALFSVLRVNLDYLKELSFAGNTKDLSNFEYLKTKEEALLKKIKDENKEKANNEETKNQIDNLELDVLYSINKETINPSGNDDKIWVTLEKMKEILSTSKINFSSNRVYAKYIIKSGLDVVDFRLSSEKEIEINKEEFLKDSKFKIYIHNTDATNST